MSTSRAAGKRTPKVVFSKTLTSAPWNTTVRPNLVEEVTALKTRPNCNMVLLGGAQTASTFVKYNLIDEYRLFVHPVLLLGGGTPLFPTSTEQAGLELVAVMTFDSDVVHVHYQRSRILSPRVGTAERPAEACPTSRVLLQLLARGQMPSRIRPRIGTRQVLDQRRDHLGIAVG
jgi:RibD C-terminal domain